MASPALSTLRGEGQLLVQDTSTVGAGLSNANWTTLINLALRWYYDNTEKRIKHQQQIVSSYTSGALDIATDAGATYPEIIQCYVATWDGVTEGTISSIDRMPWSELRFRQKIDTTTGTPQSIALVKQAGQTGATTPVNTWRVALYPIPSGDYRIRADVRDYPTALSSDTDVIELGDHEARIVVVLAAILAAPLLGRTDLVDGLVGMLPKMLQDKMASFVTHDEVKTVEGARG